MWFTLPITEDPNFSQMQFPWDLSCLHLAACWVLDDIVSHCWVWTLLSSCWVPGLFVFSMVSGFCYCFSFVWHLWWHLFSLSSVLSFCCSMYKFFWSWEGNHRAEHKHRLYHPVVQGGISDLWSHQTGMHVDQLCCGSSIKLAETQFLVLKVGFDYPLWFSGWQGIEKGVQIVYLYLEVVSHWLGGQNTKCSSVTLNWLLPSLLGSSKPKFSSPGKDDYFLYVLVYTLVKEDTHGTKMKLKCIRGRENSICESSQVTSDLVLSRNCYFVWHEQSGSKMMNHLKHRWWKSF